MKQIIGHVVVHETGTGIPNLVVTCYDCGQAADVLRRKAPTADVMKQLGRRMSAVLTDQNQKPVGIHKNTSGRIQ